MSKVSEAAVDARKAGTTTWRQRGRIFALIVLGAMAAAAVLVWAAVLTRPGPPPSIVWYESTRHLVYEHPDGEQLDVVVVSAKFRVRRRLPGGKVVIFQGPSRVELASAPGPLERLMTGAGTPSLESRRVFSYGRTGATMELDSGTWFEFFQLPTTE